jgi:phosphonate C-P lyase system protein PhnG
MNMKAHPSQETAEWEWSHECALTLMHVSREDADSMAERLRHMGFEARKSIVGMVMLSVKDCFDTPFHVGEVLASEALVAYGDAFGYGLVQGDHENRAFIAACADAATRAGDSDARRCIADWIEAGEPALREHMEREKALVKSTRVNFELMAEG